MSVLDHGFLYGDSVYETLRTSGRRPVSARRASDTAVGMGLRLAVAGDRVPRGRADQTGRHACWSQQAGKASR